MRFQGPLPNKLGATHGRGGREAHCARVLSGTRMRVKWRRPANQRGWGRGFPAALPGRPRATSGNKPAARGRGLVGRRRRAAPQVGTGTLGTPGKDSDRQSHVRASFGDGAPREVRGGLWACAHYCVTSAHPRPRLRRRPRRGGPECDPGRVALALRRLQDSSRPSAWRPPTDLPCALRRGPCVPARPEPLSPSGTCLGATLLPATARCLPSSTPRPQPRAPPQLPSLLVSCR